MPGKRPLHPDEVPEKFREYLDFDNQNSRNGKTSITARCIDCGTKLTLVVPDTRWRIKENRFSCLCLTCSGTGVRSHRWKGGVRCSSDGYTEIYSPDHPHANARKVVLEHRLVIEEHIGRYLTPVETVHHKNGIKYDNRIENLELWVCSHKSGQRYTDLSFEELSNLRDYINELIDNKSMEDAA